VPENNFSVRAGNGKKSGKPDFPSGKFNTGGDCAWRSGWPHRGGQEEQDKLPRWLDRFASAFGLFTASPVRSRVEEAKLGPFMSWQKIGRHSNQELA